MKVLDLVVKHKWYDMEECGEKPEEYRVLSDHWVKRFLRIDSGREGALRYLASLPTNQVWQEYTHVRFHRGYSKTTMLFEIKSMRIGLGNPDWGAPKEDVFIIKLGDRIDGNLLITKYDLATLGCGECDGSAFVCNNGKSVLDNAIIVWNKGKRNDNCGCFECFKKLKKR